MAPFKKADGIAKSKPDRKGLVVIRVDLQQSGVNPATSGQVMPQSGNLRELVLVEDATVGEVAEAIRKALFSDE